MLGDHDPKGSAGPPQPGVLVKLIDVPEVSLGSLLRWEREGD